jgi:hypothetical protein
MKSPPRKPSGGRKRALPSGLRRLLLGAAAAIRHEAANPVKKLDAERMGRYLVSLLVPRQPPGKKPTREVVIADGLKRDGKPWPAIYPHVFENYQKMPAYERSWRCYRLRRAVAAYVKRRRLRENKSAPHKNAN